MIRIDQHVLTEDQVSFLRQLVDMALLDESQTFREYLLDLEEVLNHQIHGGRQEILVRYIHEGDAA